MNRIRAAGLYGTLAETCEPYLTAVWENYSPTRSTITENLLSGKLAGSAWIAARRWLARGPTRRRPPNERPANRRPPNQVDRKRKLCSDYVGRSRLSEARKAVTATDPVRPLESLVMSPQDWQQGVPASVVRSLVRQLAHIGVLACCLAVWPQIAAAQSDYMAQLQLEAARTAKADWGHWGPLDTSYVSWSSHSNRLVPIYTFGIDLKAVAGANSPYRSPERLKQLYGTVPTATLNPEAEYFDQTDVYRLQRSAVAAGKKYIILLVFDGMDWQTTQAAAIYRSGQVGYTEGRGSGLKFQDYRGVDTDYGYCVTSPHNGGTLCNVDTQTLKNPGGELRGGYDWHRAGERPWSMPSDPLYPIGTSPQNKQAYPDSAATATALCSGTKTYNDAINFDPFGRQVVPLARDLQNEGFAIGVVTSVPISHATPACAYANNVHRDDYQDLSRDLLGLPSIAHPENPLPGVDVLLGAGWGVEQPADAPQGKNYVPGNRYLTRNDLRAIDAAQGGKYQVVQRTAGKAGGAALADAAQAASQAQFAVARLFRHEGRAFAVYDRRRAIRSGAGRSRAAHRGGRVQTARPGRKSVAGTIGRGCARRIGQAVRCVLADGRSGRRRLGQPQEQPRQFDRRRAKRRSGFCGHDRLD